MKFFLDTANLTEITTAASYGLIDGVTTNPSLFSKESTPWRNLAADICRAVEGPVSLEVIATETAKMIKEARELVKIGPNVVVKIPMTLDGLAAVRELSDMGIPVNTTLIFTPLQALMAAKAGAAYVSPFVGRLDDIAHDGMDGIADLVTIFDNYSFETEILVASTRTPMHVLNSALMGADVITVPWGLLQKIAKHPLTDIGLEKFLADWKNGAGKN